MFPEKLLEASVLKDKEKPACKEEDREVEEGRHSRQTIEDAIARGHSNQTGHTKTRCWKGPQGPSRDHCNPS